MKQQSETNTTALFQELSDAKKSDISNLLHKYQQEKTYEHLGSFWNEYLGQHPDLKLTDIIAASNISKDYAYQIINGSKSHPSKYKLTALCIGAGMNLKETQRALKIAGCAPLYPKMPADAVIIICLNHGCQNIMEVNELLFEHNLENPFL